MFHFFVQICIVENCVQISSPANCQIVVMHIVQNSEVAQFSQRLSQKHLVNFSAIFFIFWSFDLLVSGACAKHTCTRVNCQLNTTSTYRLCLYSLGLNSFVKYLQILTRDDDRMSFYLYGINCRRQLIWVSLCDFDKWYIWLNILCSILAIVSLLCYIDLQLVLCVARTLC